VTTTTYEEWHPHAGSVWSRFIGLWAAYVVDTTLTLTLSTPNVSSCKSIQFSTTNGTNTNVYQLVDGQANSSNLQELARTLSLPGCNTVPPVLELTYGARTTVDDWKANVRDFRWDQFVYNWCQPSQGSRRDDDWNTAFTSGKIYQSYKTLKFAQVAVIDSTCITLGPQTSTKYYYNSQPTCNGGLVEPIIVAGAGGGGSVDLAPVVDAIEELALVDYSLSLNNGASVFSMRGKVRV
jgi:hypothetical protein